MEFYNAISSGDLKRVNAVLKKGVDVNKLVHTPSAGRGGIFEMKYPIEIALTHGNSNILK
jgi:hypothetical protein